RGTVWEEIIVNAPKDVALVALSATVANVKEIADWISLVHRPIVPIHHPERPVPLSYSVADLTGAIHPIDAVRSRTASVVGAEPARGEPADERGRWYTRRAVEPQAADRAALRARPLQGRVRDGDDEPRHPHARQERRAAKPHQAHRPRLPRPHPQRADADGGARGSARHRPRGPVRDRARRPG